MQRQGMKDAQKNNQAHNWKTTVVDVTRSVIKMGCVIARTKWQMTATPVSAEDYLRKCKQ